MKQGSDVPPQWPRQTALWLLCVWMTHAHAQADMADLPLEQLMQLQVTTASRYAQTALEAPATVSVFTACGYSAA